MLAIKQTDTYRKWERKLRDQRAKALIVARVFRLANGMPGDVKPVGQGVSELRDIATAHRLAAEKEAL